MHEPNSVDFKESNHFSTQLSSKDVSSLKQMSHKCRPLFEIDRPKSLRPLLLATPSVDAVWNSVALTIRFAFTSAFHSSYPFQLYDCSSCCLKFWTKWLWIIMLDIILHKLINTAITIPINVNTFNYDCQLMDKFKSLRSSQTKHSSLAANPPKINRCRSFDFEWDHYHLCPPPPPSFPSLLLPRVS